MKKDLLAGSSRGQAELLKTLSFDDGRIKAVLLLHPGLVDAGNFFDVLKVFFSVGGR